MTESYNALPLSRRSVDRLDRRIDRTTRQFLRDVKGRKMADFFKSSRKQIGHEFSVEIRNTVEDHQAKQGFDTDQLKPFPAAIEYGLVFGAAFAKGALGNALFPRFRAVSIENLAAIRKGPVDATRDLEDRVRDVGSSFVDHLRKPRYPRVLSYVDNPSRPVDQQRQDLFLCSLGYMGATAITSMVEAEIRRASPVQRDAEYEMQKMADRLVDDSFVVPIEDIL